MPWISSWQFVQLYLVNKSAIVVILAQNVDFLDNNELCEKTYASSVTRRGDNAILLGWEFEYTTPTNQFMEVVLAFQLFCSYFLPFFNFIYLIIFKLHHKI